MENEFQTIAARVKAGYGRDTRTTESDPVIKCERCQDFGFVVLDVPEEHEDFGKSFPCRCTLELMRLYRWKLCGIPENRWCETFEACDKEWAPEAFHSARLLATDRIQLLLLCGPTGVGKTYLAHAVLIVALHSGTAARLIRAKDWLDDLKREIRHDINTGSCDSDIMRYTAIRVPVLAIDELKWRTNYDEETMDDLVCRRLNEGQRTVITSNHTVEDIKNSFPRIHSRAIDPRHGAAIWIEAGDYREYLQTKGGTDEKEN